MQINWPRKGKKTEKEGNKTPGALALSCNAEKGFCGPQGKSVRGKKNSGKTQKKERRLPMKISDWLLTQFVSSALALGKVVSQTRELQGRQCISCTCESRMRLGHGDFTSLFLKVKIKGKRNKKTRLCRKEKQKTVSRIGLDYMPNSTLHQVIVYGGTILMKGETAGGKTKGCRLGGTGGERGHQLLVFGVPPAEEEFSNEKA